MGDSEIGEKVLSQNDQSVIVDHISRLIRETWRKYEQLEFNTNNCLSQPKPLNDNSSLNIR